MNLPGLTPPGRLFSVTESQLKPKETTNAQEAKGVPANVAGGKPENRPGDLSQDAQGREQRLADFRTRRDTDSTGDTERTFCRELVPASDSFHESPEFLAVQEKAQARGIREVIAVNSDFFDACLVPEGDGKYTLVISESIGGSGGGF
jgi:hypothetical protein